MFLANRVGLGLIVAGVTVAFAQSASADKVQEYTFIPTKLKCLKQEDFIGKDQVRLYVVTGGRERWSEYHEMSENESWGLHDIVWAKKPDDKAGSTKEGFHFTERQRVAIQLWEIDDELPADDNDYLGSAFIYGTDDFVGPLQTARFELDGAEYVLEYTVEKDGLISD